MLREIYCEEFHQKRIEFSDGLNVVLGTKTADNSIGKSTFMLIIDFVFGGSTYANSTDILDNVTPHNICFKFEFDDVLYYFSRKNTDSNTVWKCDSNYTPIEGFSNEAYCKWLSEKYNIVIPQLSFRDSVGRYIRAYGKKNTDETRPLNAAPTENGNKACLAILKLFRKYHIIAQLETNAESTKDALAVFEKAQKMEYVSKIGKREYAKNQKQLEMLQQEIAELSTGLEHNLLDADAAASEEAIRIKKELSRAKRMRNALKAKIGTLDENYEYRFSQTSTTFSELQKFFPSANIAHIEEVEVFHKKISAIFRKELKEERNVLIKQLSEYDEIINALEAQLQQLIKDPKLSKLILQKYADTIKQINKIHAENDAYEKSEDLRKAKKDAAEALQKARSEQFGIIEKDINAEMERINSALYEEQYNAPVIHFTDSNYTFSTPNDTGTGIAYKGLVVFDLAIIHLSDLPILIHDSVVLKQISDAAVESIINQYISCGKQVVIALDKQESYSEKTTKMLTQHAILKLSPNGEELFGRSWGKKEIPQ